MKKIVALIFIFILCISMTSITYAGEQVNYTWLIEPSETTLTTDLGGGYYGVFYYNYNVEKGTKEVYEIIYIDTNVYPYERVTSDYIFVNNGEGFQEGVMAVYDVFNEVYSFINKSMEKVSPDLPFERVDSFYYNRALIEKDGLYGFINKDYEIVIEPIYDYASSFDEGIAIVSIAEGEYKWIDINGNEVQELQYEEKSSFTNPEDYVLIGEINYHKELFNEGFFINADYEKGKASFMRMDGSLLRFEDGITEFQYARNFERGICSVSLIGQKGYTSVINRNGKYIITPNNNISIDTKFVNGFAVVNKEDSSFFGNGIISVKPLDVAVNLNGKYIEFDQLPIIKNGRTLVPLRAIFESLGAEVTWDGATSTVTATKGNTTISLKLGSNIAYKNGEKVTIDVPAESINGRTLVPVRFISDCFGVSVEWDANSQTVYLKN